MYQSNFQYEIIDHIATLSEGNGRTKELNLISYNGQEAKLDLRIWRTTTDGKQMLKGLTLTSKEAEALRQALNDL